MDSYSINKDVAMKHLLIFISFAFSFSTFASATVIKENKKITYTSPNGQEWSRWIIVDEHEKNSDLIVTEIPSEHLNDQTTSQVLLEKKNYSNLKRNELQARVDYYLTLSDLKKRSTAYYQNFEKPSLVDIEPLWTPKKNEWTLADEKDYVEWFKQTVTADFMRGAGIKFDCADFAISIRWIYAHDHQMPMANSLAGSGKLFGHWSGSEEWNKLPTNPDWRKDERFLAALTYLLKQAYTHSLADDVYPVELTKDYLTPGTLDLMLHDKSGHTLIFYKIKQSTVSTLYGNTPADHAAERDLFYYGNEKQIPGYVHFRWPELNSGVWQLRAPQQMPGYSLEQYQAQETYGDGYLAFVYKNLGLDANGEKLASAMAYDLISSLGHREYDVAEGYYACAIEKCDPADPIYDEYSTPSRDHRIKKSIEIFQNLLSTIDSSSAAYKKITAKLKQEFIFGKTYYDYAFNVNSIIDNISSNPNDDLSTRWGILNSDDETKINLFLSSIDYSWLEQRTDDIEYVSRKCHTDDVVTCNPNDPWLKDYDTTRLDKSYRFAYDQVTSMMNAAPEEMKKRVIKASKDMRIFTGSPGYCKWNPGSNRDCNVYDYFFSGRHLMENISSNPLDPSWKRFGFLTDPR
jgi:hypothetical protein